MNNKLVSFEFLFAAPALRQILFPALYCPLFSQAPALASLPLYWIIFLPWLVKALHKCICVLSLTMIFLLKCTTSSVSCLTDSFILQGLRSDVHKHITEELSSHVGNCLKYKSESDNGNNFPQLQEDQEGRLTQLQQSELEELKNHYTQLSNVVHLLECQLKETKEAQLNETWDTTAWTRNYVSLLRAGELMITLGKLAWEAKFSNTISNNQSLNLSIFHFLLVQLKLT